MTAPTIGLTEGDERRSVTSNIGNDHLSSFSCLRVLNPPKDFSLPFKVKQIKAAKLNKSVGEFHGKREIYIS